MKKRFKRLGAMLLAGTMLLGATACGGGSNSSTTGNAAKSENSASTTETGGTTSSGDIDTSEHVVITYMVTGDKPDGKSAERLDEMMEKLNAILTEKVNAELEIYYIGWTDYLSNYNLTLAQMDGSVDLVGTASDWLDAWPNAKNGAFLELSEDMLKTYAPKTWESVSQDHWDLCKYNGSIYLIPEDNYAQWTNHGFIYRLDWAKEAGLTDGVKSWEDLTTYFKYVKEAYPDVIPWDSDGTQYAQMANGWITSHSNFVAIDGVCSGALWGGTKDDLYTITTPAYTDTDMMVEYAKLMKEWDITAVCPGPVKTEFFDIALHGGKLTSYKKWVMVKPQKVVRQAIRDSQMGREISIAGLPMKLFFILCKVLPHRLLMQFITWK